MAGLYSIHKGNSGGGNKSFPDTVRCNHCDTKQELRHEVDCVYKRKYKCKSKGCGKMFWKKTLIGKAGGFVLTALGSHFIGDSIHKAGS